MSPKIGSSGSYYFKKKEELFFSSNKFCCWKSENFNFLKSAFLKSKGWWWWRWYVFIIRIQWPLLIHGMFAWKTDGEKKTKQNKQQMMMMMMIYLYINENESTMCFFLSKVKTKNFHHHRIINIMNKFDWMMLFHNVPLFMFVIFSDVDHCGKHYTRVFCCCCFVFSFLMF